jgi:hypothetical protein
MSADADADDNKQHDATIKLINNRADVWNVDIVND